ncbi:MAG: DNA primase DnaG [archaeon]
MGKISPVAAKYIVHSAIQIDGVVDRPDVIGAVFGQTEGLLGADLELRELQRSGKIGRIEVNLEIRNGKTKGEIILPSSLDKSETAIVAAALEIIQRIGPCNAKILVDKIEDVRISKRQFVIERAKELLKTLTEDMMPDSRDLADEVSSSVRVSEIKEYGKDRVPAGPMIDESEEIIVVEGRADVLNMLKHGFKNCIAINGSSVPETVIDLCRKKVVTVFVDGDRGGNLIIQELLDVTDIDYITKAPDGKEVEELAKKEIHKALRSRIAAEQVKLEITGKEGSQYHNSIMTQQEERKREQRQQRPDPRQERESRQDSRSERQDRPERQDRQMPRKEPRKLTDEERASFSELLESLIGTRGAYILDNSLTILGKVPVTELGGTIKSLKSGIFAVIFDGIIDKELMQAAERAGVSYLCAMDTVEQPTGGMQVLTADKL